MVEVKGTEQFDGNFRAAGNSAARVSSVGNSNSPADSDVAFNSTVLRALDGEGSADLSPRIRGNIEASPLIAGAEMNFRISPHLFRATVPRRHSWTRGSRFPGESRVIAAHDE